MTKEEIYRYETAITSLVENQVLFEALQAVAADEASIADEAVVLAVRNNNLRDAQLSVGQRDGIENLLTTLREIATKYRRKTTSNSQ